MVDFARPLFPLGQVVGTPGALRALEDANQAPSDFIDRHVRGDWNELDKHDKEANEQAIQDEARIISKYTTAKDVVIWIITDADRSSTTILLPSEY